MHMKFETEIPKQTWVTLPKPCHPETEKSNMATRQPFRKWGHWKSIGSYPYTYVLCHWSLELIFKAKVKLVRKPKNPIWPPGGHFESDVTENNRVLPIYISILPLKFAVDIQSQTKVRVRKPINSNMAAWRPFWNQHCWKSIGSYPYT